MRSNGQAFHVLASHFHPITPCDTEIAVVVAGIADPGAPNLARTSC